MSPSNWTIAGDSADVSDELFRTVCRSTPVEARTLSLRLPVEERARLALYLNARSHLRHIGLTIASVCDEESLARAAGPAGRVLFQQASAAPKLTRGTTSRISLAPVSA